MRKLVLFVYWSESAKVCTFGLRSMHRAVLFCLNMSTFHNDRNGMVGFLHGKSWRYTVIITERCIVPKPTVIITTVLLFAYLKIVYSESCLHMKLSSVCVWDVNKYYIYIHVSTSKWLIKYVCISFVRLCFSIASSSFIQFLLRASSVWKCDEAEIMRAIH